MTYALYARRRWGPWARLLGPAEIPALLQHVAEHWRYFGALEWRLEASTPAGSGR